MECVATATDDTHLLVVVPTNRGREGTRELLQHVAMLRKVADVV